MKKPGDYSTHYCDFPECDAKTRSHGSAWFFTADDLMAFCPKHLPEWVAEWRAKKQAERLKNVEGSR